MLDLIPFRRRKEGDDSVWGLEMLKDFMNPDIFAEFGMQIKTDIKERHPVRRGG